MRPWQCARCLSVTNRNRQAYETLALDHSGGVADDCARCWEPAQPMLRNDLPDGRRADEDRIQLFAYGLTSAGA